jgi:hypothetical protein
MDSEGSLLCSQEPSTGRYREPDQSTLYHRNVISLRSFLILTSHLSLSLTSGLFPSSELPTKTLYCHVY